MSGDLEAQHQGIETIPTVDILKTLIKDGQARLMTICHGGDAVPQEIGIWYSPEFVVEMIEADRLNRWRDGE